MGTLPTHIPANEATWTVFGQRWIDRWRQRPVPSLALGNRKLQEAAGRIKGRIGITDQRIWLNSLPDAFRGFRVLQLSDIHHSLFVPLHQVAAVVEIANILKPDLIALTGDFVTYSRASIEPVAEILGALQARAGVVAVLGNHDFRVDANAVERALSRRKIEVLRNRHILLRRGGETLTLAGVDDYGYGADLNRALHGVPRDAATLLLAHNPRLIGLAACYGVGLMLSGHTHGGQVNLPLLGTVYGRSPERLRFKIGWDRMGATQIYVSRGIGTVVLPLRLRCPAEITRLELMSQPSEVLSPAAPFVEGEPAPPPVSPPNCELSAR